MKSILEIEKEISEIYRKIPKGTKSFFEENLVKINDENELTKSILYRLKTFYEYQKELNQFYSRGQTPPASDFFTETVLYYLKVYFKINHINYDVKSEVRIDNNKKAIRPDISIWHNNKIIAIIECKTQLGYERGNWNKNFIEREKKLNNIFPDAKAFLLVMTTHNWGKKKGFMEYKERGKKFFVLTNEWPINIDFSKNDQFIVDSVEKLYFQIKP
jgi:hypothetical protein